MLCTWHSDRRRIRRIKIHISPVPAPQFPYGKLAARRNEPIDRHQLDDFSQGTAPTSSPAPAARTLPDRGLPTTCIRPNKPRTAAVAHHQAGEQHFDHILGRRRRRHRLPVPVGKEPRLVDAGRLLRPLQSCAASAQAAWCSAPPNVAPGAAIPTCQAYPQTLKERIINMMLAVFENAVGFQEHPRIFSATTPSCLRGRLSHTPNSLFSLFASERRREKKFQTAKICESSVRKFVSSNETEPSTTNRTNLCPFTNTSAASAIKNLAKC